MSTTKDLIGKHIFYRSRSIHTAIEGTPYCAKVLKVYPLQNTILIMLKNEYQTQLITTIPEGFLHA